jgi:hypothetical protein
VSRVAGFVAAGEQIFGEAVLEVLDGALEGRAPYTGS